jgi:hypothetical protein
VENLVDHKLSESLYQRLEALCLAHVQDVAARVLHEVAGVAPEAALGIINRHWNDFCQGQVAWDGDCSRCNVMRCDVIYYYLLFLLFVIFIISPVVNLNCCVVLFLFSD